MELAEPLSAVERSFERLRRRAGLSLAPVAFAAVLLWAPTALQPEARRLAAVMAAVIILWITEALPMPVTAMLGAAACVVLQVAPAREVFAPFADPLMFLFIGSFILARAIFVHHLDRRLAFSVLSIGWVGARPGRILFAFGAVTAFLSAWISNTATTALMFAIGLSILGFMLGVSDGVRGSGRGGDPATGRASGAPGSRINLRYATGLMLMTSFAASIGGLATPIGTPPNLIGLGFIRKMTGAELSFFKWVVVGAPVVICLFLFLYGYMNYFCRSGVREIEGAHAALAHEKARLGRWTTGQRSTATAFLVTVGLWIGPGVVALIAGEGSDTYQFIQKSMPEGAAALLGAGLLFLLPGNGGGRAITWNEASRIDWGVVLLYGGGVALGELASKTGLAAAVGQAVTLLVPLHGELGLLIVSTLMAVVLSETTSNTASATIVVPVVIEIARAAGADPLAPALGATMGSSLGFMLPVSTPCNAIVYSSGYIPLVRMIRYGLLLDVAGVIVIVTLIHFLAPMLR